MVLLLGNKQHTDISALPDINLSQSALRDLPITMSYFPVLGNMWSQSWGNLLDICKPYPEKASVDVTPQMKAQVRAGTPEAYQPGNC